MKSIQDYLKEVDKISLIRSVVDLHIERSWDTPNEKDIESLVEAYTSVYLRLIEFGEWTWFRSKYSVSAYVNPPLEIPDMDDEDNEPFLDISLLNKHYEEPPVDAKWWGGDSKIKDDAPVGHYNVNYECYAKYFSIDFMPWRVTVNLELDIDESALEYTIEQILAEYIYNVTFNGFQEIGYLKSKKELMSILDEKDSIPYEEAMKELNDYTEDRSPIEPQGEDDIKIRFSKRSVEDIKKMIDKSVDSDNV